jgi:hypothetical protein
MVSALAKQGLPIRRLALAGLPALYGNSPKAQQIGPGEM